MGKLPNQSPVRKAPRPMVSRPIPDQVARAEEHQRKKMEKIELAKEAKGNAEVGGCTFEPNLDATKTVSPTRDLDSFIRDQENFAERKNKKILERQALK